MDNNLRRLSKWTLTGAAISIASLTFVLGRQPWVDSATLNDLKAGPRAVSPRGELWPDEKLTVALFRQALPVVVNITAIGVQRDPFTLNLYQIPQGNRLRICWDTQGNIITNFHVIQNAAAAQVTLGGQSN